MKVETTAIRLKRLLNERGLKQVDLINLAKPYCDSLGVKLNKNDLSQYISGKVVPGEAKLKLLALALEVSETWLMGYDMPIYRESAEFSAKYPSPSPTESYATFPVIGEIAAGYDSIALQEWKGETVDIPLSLLKGRDPHEFFVLSVKGDSMYPMYMENDKVLILKRSYLSFSGQVGAVLYDGELATLKRVEFSKGEEWLRLVPINPNFPPKEIEGPELERCKIIGIPKLLIRDIN